MKKLHKEINLQLLFYLTPNQLVLVRSRLEPIAI